jgi:glycosyltransferase involved in cell wall biosynthesis
MISVIIPVLDVSATVGAVVKLALADPRVSEVIVVDDGSIDGTPDLAASAGARVITSSLLGKGASMRDGLNAALDPHTVKMNSLLRSDFRQILQRLFDSRALRQPETQARAVWAMFSVRETMGHSWPLFLRLSKPVA